MPFLSDDDLLSDSHTSGVLNIYTAILSFRKYFCNQEYKEDTPHGKLQESLPISE